jgi:hypothetical protein
MRLDASGNLGLGVTPSAWNSGYKAFVAGGTNGNDQVGGIASGSGITIVSTNYYRSSTPDEIYAGTGYAMKYLQSSGQHQWYTAASGTAGNAISFTQAMTLTAGSQLLVGTTTSPSGSAPALVVQTSVGGGVQYAHGSGGGGLIYALTSGGLTFNTYTGAVGSESYTERARITSDGSFLVGTTSASGNNEKVNITGNVADFFFRTSNTNASPAGMTVIYSNAVPNNTGNDFIYCQDQTTVRFVVRSNGGIANYSANDVNLSDRREKTNFAPATSYLDKICAIPVQTFNYIDQNMEEDGGLTLGVVAQDVQAVAPELVMESNWARKDDEPKMRLSIYQTDLQYALMKCIQEQQAIIESLKARLDAANL